MINGVQYVAKGSVSGVLKTIESRNKSVFWIRHAK